MARINGIIWLAMALGSMAGCASGPLALDPALTPPPFARRQVENPLFVPQGVEGYSLVFDRAYDAVNNYFDISYSNRFDGRIESWPAVAAGYAQLWQFGLYDNDENLESTLQTIRRRALVMITPAESGGYYIDVHVYKELEDLAQPIHSSTGAAVFRRELPIERTYEVVDPLVVTQGWIPIGRDACLEQAILERLKACL